VRPVNKGKDAGEFKPYQDAQNLLQERIGEFCSYCERWIASAIHVEHKQPKNEYPKLQYSWQNFLLSCSNCNSTKSHGKLNLDDYVWPDVHNTFLAFQYAAEGKIHPVTGFGPSLDARIDKTWKTLGLNRHPDTATNGFEAPTTKDKRWTHRRDEWEKAHRRQIELKKYDTPHLRGCIVDMAASRGMFSIWFTVFSDDIDMRRRLIEAFIGTDKTSFDDEFQPVKRTATL